VAVLRKMMAKKPDERYQTPAEVAAALASLLSIGSGTSMLESEPNLPSLKASTSGTDPGGDTIPSVRAETAPANEGTDASASPPLVQREVRDRRWLLCGAVGFCLVLLVMVALLFVFL
jgi:hypothetical protein